MSDTASEIVGARLVVLGLFVACGRARDAVDESMGTACEDDITAGTVVAFAGLALWLMLCLNSASDDPATGDVNGEAFAAENFGILGAAFRGGGEGAPFMLASVALAAHREATRITFPPLPPRAERTPYFPSTSATRGGSRDDEDAGSVSPSATRGLEATGGWKLSARGDGGRGGLFTDSLRGEFLNVGFSDLWFLSSDEIVANPEERGFGDDDVSLEAKYRSLPLSLTVSPCGSRVRNLLASGSKGEAREMVSSATGGAVVSIPPSHAATRPCASFLNFRDSSFLPFFLSRRLPILS